MGNSRISIDIWNHLEKLQQIVPLLREYELHRGAGTTRIGVCKANENGSMTQKNPYLGEEKVGDLMDGIQYAV